MTIDEAKELAENLNQELKQSNAITREKKAKIAALDEERSHLQSALLEQVNIGKAIAEKRDAARHAANGLCQAEVSSRDRFYSTYSPCKKKSKPGEEYCGVHLRRKKADEARRNRYA